MISETVVQNIIIDKMTPNANKHVVTADHFQIVISHAPLAPTISEQ